LVTNAGSCGKFLAVLDLELAKGKVSGIRYHLLPVFSELLKPDPAMAALVEDAHAPHAAWLAKIATSERLLYRRGNFSGPLDQLICDALRSELDAEIALSPGFRWGTTALAGQVLTMEDLLSETAITYPETYVQTMTGAQIKAVLEDVCDNLFNPDPYYSAGRRHGPHRRPFLCLRACRRYRPQDFGSEARRWPAARGRQALQGRGLGVRK